MHNSDSKSLHDPGTDPFKLAHLPRILAVIPARYASVRFPGKPLVEIQGKPMIQHVWERVKQVKSIHDAIIATDDPRIKQAAESFGAQVCLTRADHPSGTDRAWEVAATLPDYDWILNVQGDEPLINPAHLETAIQGIQDYNAADLITLVSPLHDFEEWHDPNIVKAVLAQDGRALYFSRSPVPYHRETPGYPRHTFRHVGIYLYRRTILEQFTQLAPSPLEQIEKLEQLRALEAGMAIYAAVVDEAPIGVDTPHDLVRIADSLRERLPRL